MFCVFGVQERNEFIKVWNRLPGVPEKGVVLGKLSLREMEIGLYLVQGLRAIDIALLFHPLTVETIRGIHMNIRRKLGASTPEGLRAAWEKEMNVIEIANDNGKNEAKPQPHAIPEHSSI